MTTLKSKYKYPYYTNYTDKQKGYKSFRIYYLNETGKRRIKNVRDPKERDEFIKGEKQKAVLRECGLEAKLVPFSDTEIRALDTLLNLLQAEGFYNRGDDASADQIVRFGQWFVQHYDDSLVEVSSTKVAVKKFLESRKHLDEKTQKQYASSMKALLKQARGKGVDQITPAIIDKMVRDGELNPIVAFRTWLIAADDYEKLLSKRLRPMKGGDPI